MEMVLSALGVEVIEVPGMKDEACWVKSQRVGLLRAGMPDEDREAGLDYLMERAFLG